MSRLFITSLLLLSVACGGVSLAALLAGDVDVAGMAFIAACGWATSYAGFHQLYDAASQLEAFWSD